MSIICLYILPKQARLFETQPQRDGLSSAKRISQALRGSPDFNSVCDSVYEECLSLTENTFPGVKPYQVGSASDRIHQSLSLIHYPLVQKWVPSPPSRSQDKALRSVIRRFDLPEEETGVCVPIGVTRIAGIGMATRSEKDLVGTTMGVYALDVATLIYLSLAG